jgi:predicted dinucleotide-binding enzyme
MVVPRVPLAESVLRIVLVYALIVVLVRLGGKRGLATMNTLDQGRHRGAGATVAGGHRVEIVDRDQAEAQKLASELGENATALEPGASLGGEIIVFAVYYPGIKDAVQDYGDQLAGKVVVDITNPVDTQTWDKLATPPGTSSAEEVAQLVPPEPRW